MKWIVKFVKLNGLQRPLQLGAPEYNLVPFCCFENENFTQSYKTDFIL